MRYHPDDFLAVTEEVERQGGYLQPESCDGRVIRYKLPGPSGRQRWKRITTAHCGRDDARVAVPYETPDDEEGFAAVCLVDDDVGRWPRFANTLTKR